MHSNPVPLLRDVAQLYRLRVTGMVALSTLFGGVLASGAVSVALLLTIIACALLACGCSALNQVQERALDRMLPRTRLRPVAAGRMKPATALAFACLPMLLAAVCFWRAGGAPLLAAGILVVALYNGAYTPLKRHTSFALLVGALPGAMPPVIGWIGSGGDVASHMLAVVYLVYYLWQVPHFWLRVQRDSDAYLHAGLPLPAVQFTSRAYAHLLQVWFHAYAVALLALPAMPLLHSLPLRVTLVGCGMVLLVASAIVGKRTALALAAADGVLVIVMVILAVDRVALL